MVYLALILQLFFLFFAFVVRSVLHARRTGSIGFRVGAVRKTPVEVAGAGLITIAGVVSAAGVVLDLLDVLDRVSFLDHLGVEVAGCALAITGLALVLKAQADMGTSWRIGVDTTERTDLVTGGLFQWTRNPIFLGMLVFWAGMSLMVPNVLALAATVTALAGVEVQVRLVEEPYLIRTHGDAYRHYASRTGRLLPGVEKLKGRT